VLADGVVGQAGVVCPMPERLIRPLIAARIVAMLQTASAKTAIQAAGAAARGGLQALELSFTTAKTAEALEELRSTLPKMLIGVGKITNAAQAEEAVRDGAQFLSSTHLAEDVLRIARKWNVPYMPGVLTPSEIAHAQRLNCTIFNIFPVKSLGGLAYLASLYAVSPDLQLVVSGEIEPNEVQGYLSAGALAVKLNIFSATALESSDWQMIETEIRQAIALTELLR
jgi:2-dehydro-3-deoxyphosphogluconate aldolase / (4S)-4-hydroxy-2-oxoglutarate aldolase